MVRLRKLFYEELLPVNLHGVGNFVHVLSVKINRPYLESEKELSVCFTKLQSQTKERARNSTVVENMLVTSCS